MDERGLASQFRFMDKMDFCAMRKGGLCMDGIVCFVINHIVGFSTSSSCRV